VNGQEVAKAAREVKVGDTVAVRREGADAHRSWCKRRQSAVRGPAPVAQHLYEETPESLAGAREGRGEQRRYAPEPALSASNTGVPPSATGASWTQARRVDWDSRWSASLDPDDS
jgi:ribosome-associated heat shock protein Hsp15